MFCIYADKTKLSSFGTQKGYPVIARCTNLPVGLQNGTGIGGGRIVGWLPIASLCLFFSPPFSYPQCIVKVEAEAAESGKRNYVDFK